MVAKTVMKRYWLRKVGTNLVFQRTKILATRDDMVPITEEKAMELRQIEKARRLKEVAEQSAKTAGLGEEPTKKAAVNEEKQRLIDEGLIPAGEGDEAPKKKTIDEMNKNELAAALTELKVPVDDDMEEEALRATLKAIVSADNKVPVDDDSAPVQLAPEEPAAAKPEPEVDYTEFSKKELKEHCDKKGIPFEGKRADIIAALQNAK